MKKRNDRDAAGQIHDARAGTFCCAAQANPARVDVVLALAAVSGFLCVALGAFGAHALKGTWSAERMVVFNTAVQYQFWHCLALLAVGVIWRSASDARLLGWTAAAWLTGMVLFSGSLYALGLTQWRWLGFVTPLGGILLLSGWFLLALDRVLAIRTLR